MGVGHMDWLLMGLFLALLLVAAIFAGLWTYRALATGDASFSFGWLLPARPVPRLGVMEEARVDRSRRLLLIRRDDVEHLIMTGGPVDVVIETGIAAPQHDAVGVHGERHEPPPPVFARKARPFGQAVNE
jgi:flagellar protein FliO/FliZ